MYCQELNEQLTNLKMITTVGIVCDDYKLSKYEHQLKKNGFTFSLFPFLKTTTIIKVTTDSERVGEIHKICEDLEKHFLTLKN